MLRGVLRFGVFIPGDVCYHSPPRVETREWAGSGSEHAAIAQLVERSFRKA